MLGAEAEGLRTSLQIRKRIWSRTSLDRAASSKQRADKEYKAAVLSGFSFELSELELLDTEWKDSRFHAIIERITVHNDGRLVFTFRNGSEETVMM